MKRIHRLFHLFLLLAISSTADGQKLVPFFQTNKETNVKRWGFSDRFYADVVIKCQYDSTMSFTEGLGRVIEKGKYGFVDKNGKIIIPAKYDGAMEFSEGLAAVFLDGKAFFIDKKGADVFKKTFKSVSSFSHVVAMCAGEDGKRGFIDAKGNVVVPLTLEAAFPFGDKLTPVRFDGEKIWKAINTKGELVFTFSDKVKNVLGSFSDGMAMVYVDGPSDYNVHYDFVNEKGEFVCDVPYASAEPFKNGRAIIANVNKERKGNNMQFFKYGLIKKGGLEIVRSQYPCLQESLIPGIYFYGKASTSLSGCNGWGLLDSNGKELTQSLYQMFTKLNDTTFLCKEAGDYESLGKYLLFNTKGKNLLSLNHSKYFFTIAGTDTLLMLYSKTSDATVMTVYNIHQGLLKENAFDGVKVFEKKRLLLIEDWKYSGGTLMTTSGQIIADKIKTDIPYFDNAQLDQVSLLLLKKSDDPDFRLYNINTGKYIAPNLQFIKDKSLGFYDNHYSEGLLAAGQKDKWGFIDSTGKFKIPPIYESVEDFHEGWAVVMKKEKGEDGEEYMVYINKAGKELPGIKAGYLYASEFNEGIARYKTPSGSKKKGLYYINKTGREIFKVENDDYFAQGEFSEGLAAVCNMQGKYGYIDKTGNLAIPYQFSLPKGTRFPNQFRFKNGKATVIKDGKYITIDKTGNEIK